jgi:hypothetical protein
VSGVLVGIAIVAVFQLIAWASYGMTYNPPERDTKRFRKELKEARKREKELQKELLAQYGEEASERRPND